MLEYNKILPTSMRMKRSVILIVLFALSCLFSFSYLQKIFYSNIQETDDYTISSLIQKIPLNERKGTKLLSHEKFHQIFTAGYDNLGTIAIRFDKPKAFTDTIFFRIKEKDKEFWTYEQAYQAHTFDPGKYYTFGFPPIADSKNRQYAVELESLGGTNDSTLSFHPSTPNIVAKYVYPKAYFLTHKEQLIPFLRERTYLYLTYIPLMDFLHGLFICIFPFLFIKFLVIFWHVSNQLEQNKRFSTYMRYIAPAFLFLITTGVYGYLSSIGADAHHDGALFKPALDVARGSMLYRDTFFFYGAFVPLIQASALLLFGKYLLTLKLLTVFFYGCNVLLIYAVARRFLPELLLFSISLLWIFMAPYFFYMSYNWTTLWSSVYAIFFQLLTSYFMIRSLETKQNRFIFLAGGTTAFAFWCRQPVGVFLFLAIAFFYTLLFLQKNISKKELAHTLKIFILGTAGVSSIFLFWIITNNAFNDWWRQTILRANVWAQENGSGYAFLGIVKALFPPSKSIVSLWTLIPIATVIVGIRSFVAVQAGKHTLPAKIILVLACIGLSSWPQYFPYNDPAHAFWAATPMVSLLALFIYEFTGGFIFYQHKPSPLAVKFTALTILVILFLPDISYRISDAVKKIKEPYFMVSAPSVLTNIRLTKEEAVWYTYVANHIEEYFRENPSGNVITNGPDSLYLTFDPRIKNYQPVYMNWWLDAVYPEYERNKDAYLKDSRPFLISYFEFLPEGYCRIDSFVKSDSTFLATPCRK